MSPGGLLKRLTSGSSFRDGYNRWRKSSGSPGDILRGHTDVPFNSDDDDDDDAAVYLQGV